MKTSLYSPHYDKLRVWLKSQREKQSLSLREVSERWGRHHSVLGKIEQARRKIEIVEFIELCEVLDIDPHDGLSVLYESIKKKN